ncbi:agouti signaling protein 1 [Polypterus senegalus]|uniref:agouti signaling protein 1 n=1 Tax=Polypterus senegalus TaxID=55291 RepID=UPI0019624888|nr:agouti signaling protein 1 [Polypterus senegalus]
MNTTLLYYWLLFSSLYCLIVCSRHLALEELTARRNESSPFFQGNQRPETAPVIIIEMPEASRKKSQKAAEKKLRKVKPSRSSHNRKPRPAPSAKCMPLWGTCRNPGMECCHPCAYCHCRLLRTICYCRMGNPNC